MKRRIIFIVLILLVLGALVWLASRPREPVYQGKTLSEWLRLQVDDFNNPDAQDAVRHIGTNGIPTLLRMLRQRDSRLKLRLFELTGKQDFVKLDFSSGRVRNLEAAEAFAVLGPAASNAVPGLIQVLHERVSDWSRVWTIYSLCSVGPAARPAVPELIRAVGDTNANREVRLRAMTAVVDELQADPGLVVPALIKCLKDTNSDVRLFAARALGQLGSAAKAAVPALVTLLNDPEYFVRLNAGDALKAIDPEAAAKAGVK
jgi:HEAT repeats